MFPNIAVIIALFLTVSAGMAQAQPQQKMPREDVIDVPAISDDLCVSNVFQSNMVLQRNKPIAIWGWGSPGKQLQVEFGRNQKTTTVNSDRSWKLSLPAMEVNSKPASLTVTCDDSTVVLHNVLVGDVWVLGGQSNMEFPLDRIENGQLEIISANYPNIRILTVPAADGPDERPSFPRLHEWSDWFGRHYRKGDWDECSPEIAREFSAIGYVFARRIHMASNIPIGIIDASRGGTTVETWTPEEVLRNLKTPEVDGLLNEWDQKVAAWDSQADLESRVKRFRERAEKLKQEDKQLPSNEVEPSDLRPGPALDQNRPGNCYASMIAPLAGLSVKGAIFHQGYNNCFNGTQGITLYRQVFPKMIASWRAAFGDPQMPFGILSLCTEGPVQTLDNFCEMMSNPGPYLREAQYQTFLELYQAGDTDIGFVSTYDLRRRWYHPQLKIPAGERIARWALATEYGFDRQIRWKPPIVEEVTADGNQLVLRFDEAAAAVDNGGPILGFAVAGSDGNFQPADASHQIVGKDDRGRPKTDSRTIVLTSPLVPAPVHFRYAWGRSPLGNLQASRNTDIPFATQRSDTWPLENTPLGVLGDTVVETADRRQKREIQEALKALDQKRQLFHARALLEETNE